MFKESLEQYLNNLTNTFQRGDAREESYYKHLDELFRKAANLFDIKNIDITILPKKTEAGNPDFRVWDGKAHITGYIEAKDPSVTNLDYIEDSEQLKRYCSTFPNVILTNFYEFRLYRNNERLAQVMIGRPITAKQLKTTPPVENIEKFKELLNLFFSFSLPKVQTAKSLAIELAKRTRFLRDEVVSVEMEEEGSKGHKQITGFYEAFKKYLIATLTEKQFADLYAQTITYGLFAARTRADGEFNRRLAFDYIPHTIGILRDVFRFISLEEPPKSLQIIVEDIAEILQTTDANKILHEYHKTGKGRDPIIHFYETFLATYDPEIRERRGVYYTPEAVVGYIVRSIHSILKSHFGLADGLASEEVKLLDPAGGTLTFPAEAIHIAAEEHKRKYGTGDLHQWIKRHILKNYYAFELMMAPYAIGHLKMGFVFDEFGYRFADDEGFNFYLTNTLEMEDIEQIDIPGLSSLSEESHLAGKVKKEQPLLVILGNPPYSGISSNPSEEKIQVDKGKRYITQYAWNDDKKRAEPIYSKPTKKKIQIKQKTFVGEILMDYYFVDGKSLGEKNPKWLQDDYVKFLRFAQWKIQTSGFGIVGIITNHSYLDNPTFRGMRQSLMQTFDEIYILNLHGNSLKKEMTPEGGKDENVFDIRQGVAIVLFVRNKEQETTRIYHKDLYGLREEKYSWMENNEFVKKNYDRIKPESPYYLFTRRDTEKIKQFLEWKKVTEIFPLNGVGMTTARDNFVIDFKRSVLENRIRLFQNSKYADEDLHKLFEINRKKGWDIRKAWNMLQSLSNSELKKLVLPVTYRPFDDRYIFWHDAAVWRTVKYVMRHMTKPNIGLTVGRQGQVVGLEHSWNLIFLSENMIDFNLYYRGGGLLLPLYVYPDDEKNAKTGSTMMMVFESVKTYGKKPNIAPIVLKTLETTFKKKSTPEDILYYIYGVFYSNIYRETYAEFLRIDFPRVPFTANYELFKEIGKLGKELVGLHLLKSPALDNPIAKYQGAGDNDRIEKVTYNDDERRIYVNKEKYFEGIKPDVWNYHIGGYQVLQKYIKDRKGRIMDDAPRYCRIITALSKTIEIQETIDEVYPEIEKKLINF